MTNSNIMPFTQALWVLLPALVLIAAATYSMRTERFARAMQDVTKAERILNAIDWIMPVALSAFIVTMLWRIKDTTGFYPGAWTLADVTANKFWTVIWVVVATIGTLQSGEAMAPHRLAKRVAIAAACVLGIQLLPLAVDAVGAPACTMYAVLFGLGVAWLKLTPAGRTPEQHVADERAADEAIARLTPAQRADIDALLRKGKYIEVVRDLRKPLGGDLRLAKNTADRLRIANEPAIR